MGHPGGYQEDRGAVLRLGRVLLSDDEAITTNCTLVGGDSGGPLFDMDGRVIGINSRIAERLTTNMHVPVNAYNERGAWNRLVNGEVWGHMPGQDPWLGVGGDGESKGAKIASVTPKSPAEKYGLQPGDIVIGFDGREIGDFEALKKAVADCQPDEWVRLKILRGDREHTIGMRLGKKD
jgi:serine protease Do